MPGMEQLPFNKCLLLLFYYYYCYYYSMNLLIALELVRPLVHTCGISAGSGDLTQMETPFGLWCVQTSFLAHDGTQSLGLISTIVCFLASECSSSPIQSAFRNTCIPYPLLPGTFAFVGIFGLEAPFFFLSKLWSSWMPVSHPFCSRTHFWMRQDALASFSSERQDVGWAYHTL